MFKHYLLRGFMMNETNKLHVYHELVSCEMIYDAEKAWVELQTRESIEIGMVVSGSGTHAPSQ